MTELLISSHSLVNVAVPVPVGSFFTYLAPEEMQSQIKVGIRVSVPFRNREIIGYVIGYSQGDPPKRLKAIASVIDKEPVLSEEILQLCEKISSYYGCSMGEAIENALPKWVKYGKKASRFIKKIQFSEEANVNFNTNDPNFSLTEEQSSALETIQRSLRQEAAPQPIYLHGVTGSGKSEIYIRTIHQVLEQNRTAIVLVPEITLTEQLKRFFITRFGHCLEILHSKLSEGERFTAWKRLEKGTAKVVLGPRSALFAPLKNVGVIILDEEHENSYKQETVPRYHAREVALWRAQIENALLIMGSATPSLESLRLCEEGVFVKKDLAKRVDDRKMPIINIVDLKEQMAIEKRHVILSRVLKREIEKNLKSADGTILLLNRRGFSSHIHCPKCGHSEDCNSCHVSLTFHQERGALVCHYCNAERKVQKECPSCHAELMKFSGAGTEKVESEVARLFPTAKIGRMDTDSIRRKGSHEVILQDFRDKKIDILIGTQMIAKGFDFPHVTLVGVVLADVGLMLPDFRSSERTFQLLTQVAGRAGRGKKEGRVIIQTFSPHHPAVKLAYSQDVAEFYKYSKPERVALGYPPFKQMVNIIIRGSNEKRVALFAAEMKNNIAENLSTKLQKQFQVELVGASPLPFYKLRGNFRWHIMLKFRHSVEVTQEILQILSKQKRSSTIQMAIDVDPVNVL